MSSSWRLCSSGCAMSAMICAKSTCVRCMRASSAGWPRQSAPNHSVDDLGDGGAAPLTGIVIGVTHSRNQDELSVLEQVRVPDVRKAEELPFVRQPLAVFWVIEFPLLHRSLVRQRRMTAQEVRNTVPLCEVLCSRRADPAFRTDS